MFRNILAVVAGMAAAFITIGIVQQAGQFVFPPPQDLDVNNKEQIEEYLKNAPVLAMLFVLLSYLLGSFAGGAAAAAISKGRKITVSLVTGFLVMAAGVAHIFIISHPAWFVIASLAVYIPAAWAGGKLVAGRK